MVSQPDICSVNVLQGKNRNAPERNICVQLKTSTIGFCVCQAGAVPNSANISLALALRTNGMFSNEEEDYVRLAQWGGLNKMQTSWQVFRASPVSAGPRKYCDIPPCSGGEGDRWTLFSGFDLTNQKYLRRRILFGKPTVARLIINCQYYMKNRKVNSSLLEPSLSQIYSVYTFTVHIKIHFNIIPHYKEMI
jgi:hypothetical protein